jgi:histidine triad (HIT) family protein
MPACLFCDIARGARTAHLVYETPAAVAFLDIHPLADGHAMVIPREHYVRLVEMPAGAVGQLFAAVREVTARVNAATNTRDATIGINDGPGAGQVVPHLHVHVVPRAPGDGGGTIHSIIRTPARCSLEEMRDRIRGLGRGDPQR